MGTLCSIQMDGFKSLTKGDVVSFDLEENPHLKEQSRRAVNVKKLVKFDYQVLSCNKYSNNLP